MTLEEMDKLKVGDLIFWTGQPYPRQLAIIVKDKSIYLTYKVLKSYGDWEYHVGRAFEIRFNEWETAIKLSNKIGRILYG